MVDASAAAAAMAERPTLLIFGPQTALPDHESLSRLRLVLLSEPRLSPFLVAIRGLSQLWRSLVKAFPRFEAVPGLQVLEDLESWIVDEHDFPQTIYPLPNVLLSPLTVIMQIAHYANYLRVMQAQDVRTRATHQALLKDLKIGGAQGLCIGVLSAIALACSADEEDLVTWGAVALRLAVCVGAVVDLEGAFATPSNEAFCFTVRYDTNQKDLVQNILEQFPESYISVDVDPTHSTITASKSIAPRLMQRMSTAGLVPKPILLEGRFHTRRHENALADILSLCKLNPVLQFPSAERLKIPVRSNTSALLLTQGSLHELALTAILTETPNWSLTIAEATAGLDQEKRYVLAIGNANFIPQSVLKANKLRVTYLHSFVSTGSPMLPSLSDPAFTEIQALNNKTVGRKTSSDDIAVVGMACRFPGANTIEEFWELLCAGKSMCRELPTSRFSTQKSRRMRSKEVRYWGNFLDEPDVFDHRFFNMSSREASSTDPQQRLVLQVAYEAMESAGYFDELSKTSSIGCYLGVGSVDYHDNVFCHPPTAFSASGTLRAFISGKISHFFGWTGPSITYDTACSSSAVAIHSACMALRSGECTAALAGGVNLITSPALHQNLDKGGFLSPTGPSKAFDAKADGYCRGEGAGLVVLKKLSAAIADGDVILGVIAGSAVGQNDNCTPITVPHSQSQAELYKKVTLMAGIDPRDVSFVEAHGTGTKVGDPIECESIRQVFGGSQRHEKLYFGSVKSNIGHTEGASGAAGLIKTLLMIQKGMVPAQPNFSMLNPKIPPLSLDKMAIPTSTQKMNLSAICINNYGAAGSNAALILCAPPMNPNVSQGRFRSSRHLRFPISISAHSAHSLHAYCMSLRQFLLQKATQSSNEFDLASIAFNLAHKTNHSLPMMLNITARSLSELKDELLAFECGPQEFHSLNQKEARKPVVLCFGGQTMDTVGLNEEVYRSVLVLRNHLDSCDAVSRSLGGQSLIPGIFSKEPVQDIILLHSLVFSLQYSCAMAWIDCGLKVDALIGHSFGQLTALCVAGSLSLEHAMRLVRGRASLIQNLWGPQRGAMLSIEASSAELSEVLSHTRNADPSYYIEVACYNSPTSHVIVGSAESIQAAEHVIEASPVFSQSVKFKRLNVTHGYHSHFVDSILPGLIELVDSLEFREPTIHIETTTSDQSWRLANSTLIAQHSREPVYFSQAVHRIEKRYGTCVWLEAGSDSTITSMARRAFGTSLQAGHIFQSVSLTSPNAWDQVAIATANLWNAGLGVQFWSFHRCQRQDYAHINLPPYQFEKTRHWLDYVETEEMSTTEVKATAPEPIEKLETVSQLLTFISFMRPQNIGVSLSEFSIDPGSEKFKAYVSGHSVLGNNLCPASLYLHLAIKAVSMIIEEATLTDHTLSVESLELESPLGIDEQRAISLKLRETDDNPLVWSFEISSYQLVDLSNHVRHATGAVYAFVSRDSKLRSEFARYERLTANRHAYHLTHNEKEGVESSIEGSFVYKAFSSVVNYSDYFRGVRKVAARGDESVGRVFMPEVPSNIAPDRLWDPLLVDNFLQVAGLHVNCLRDKLETEIYICTKIDQLTSSPEFSTQNSGIWSVFSNFEQLGEKDLVNDIFVFESETGRLAVMILGARFTKVSTGSLSKVLSRVNTDGKLQSSGSFTGRPQNSQKFPEKWLKLPPTPPITPEQQIEVQEQHRDIPVAVRQLLNRVTDVPIERIQNDTALETIGLDSLMTTEVLDELNEAFGIRIAMHELQALIDFKSLCWLVESKNPSNILLINDQEETSGGVQTAAVKTSAVNGLQSKVHGKNSPANEGPPIRHFEERTESADTSTSLLSKLASFGEIQNDFDSFADETKLTGFYTKVYPRQVELVVSYVTEAFENFGVSLSNINEGDDLPSIPCISKHRRVTRQMYDILWEANLIRFKGPKIVRTGQPVDETPTEVLLGNIIRDFPQHTLEHKLLSTTGSVLADCLSGKTDPLQVLFSSRENRDLLEDVYTNAPMFNTGTRLLTDFLLKVTADMHVSRPIRILEVGAGTGATTKHILKQLTAQGTSFIYTFTDISSSLVTAAKKKFASYVDSMEFMILNIEEDPSTHLLGSQDIVISTNCVHATKRLAHSCSNIRKILRSDGILCLIELTRNLYWFDLVFGLLEGWWLFDDSRTHALAHESFWKQSLEAAGFGHVDWSRGQSKESELIRLIIAAATAPARQVEPRFQQVTHPGEVLEPETSGLSETRMETILFKQEGRIPLYADIYYPEKTLTKKTKLPIALMIHGGGHVMLSRKDIRPLQTELLLDNGLLPISIDHRLCPELDLIKGPMTDVCSALEWARNVLPTLELERSDIQADGTKVVVIGWSTGGTLAMSMGWTAPARGIQPPEAILVFYCPTDYQAEWWTRPHFPWGTSQADADRPYDIWETIRDTPITGFNIASARAIGGWMSTSDPRARIPLHMNWTAQTLPILLGATTSHQKALRRKKEEAAAVPLAPLSGHSKLSFPTKAEIAPISPRAQIVSGAYRAPTYIIHGTADDFIPWKESQDTYAALVERGIPAGLSIVEGGGHIFEMRGIPKGDPAVGRAVLDGYRFLLKRVGVDIGEYGKGREKW